MIESALTKLATFRGIIHQIIPSYRDATLDLIDALSSNHHAKSITALSENIFFRRKYASITKVIQNFLVSNKVDDVTNEESSKTSHIKENNDFIPNQKLQKAIQTHIVNLCSTPRQRNFFCLPVM